MHLPVSLECLESDNLLNTGPHPVDQAVYLYGTETQPDVFCGMDQANSFGDAEDYVNIAIRGAWIVSN